MLGGAPLLLPAQPAGAELGDRRRGRQGLAAVEEVAAGDDVGDEIVDQPPERVAVVVEGAPVQGVGVAALLLQQGAGDHDVRGVDRARHDAHGLGEVEDDALHLVHGAGALIGLHAALPPPVELQQDVVEALLADHLPRPHEGVGRRHHVADQQVAEMVAAHRDRDGEIGLRAEAHVEDGREMVLPRPPQRRGIPGRLEPQAGDLAARRLPPGRCRVQVVVSLLGRHT